MARKPGNLDAKRNEIILKSQELFFTNGIEKTSISSITKSLNISKGLFYYYFDSKDSLIEAVMNNFLYDAESKMLSIINNNELTFKEKINQCLYSLSDRFTNIPEAIAIYCHSEGFIDMHDKLMDKFINRLMPHFMAAIDIAIEKKELDIPYPHESLQIFIYGLTQTIHSLEYTNKDLNWNKWFLEKAHVIFNYYFS